MIFEQLFNNNLYEDEKIIYLFIKKNRDRDRGREKEQESNVNMRVVQKLSEIVM